MKNSQMIQLIQEGNLVIPIYLLKNYKKFVVELEEFIFLMYLYHLGDKHPFDPNSFSKELNIDISTIMKYIASLTEKKLIKVDVIKNEKDFTEEVILLDDFYQKIKILIIEESNEEINPEDSDVFETIEKEFGRTLSPMEFEIIKAWLQNGTSESIIKEALKEATFNGVSNLRYIDKILYEWNKSGVKEVKDVEELRKKRKKNNKENDVDIDLDIVDWNWFDEDE